MPTKNVIHPFNTKPVKSIDPIGLHQLSETLMNGTMEISEENIVTRKRLGLKSFKDIGTNKAISGTYWWEEKSILIVVSEGNIYKIIDEVGTLVNITGDQLETSGKVSFAQNGSTLVMANGGRMVTTDGSANTAYISDADAPTTVSHVAFLDYWLIVNKVGTGYFYFADFIFAPTVWLSIDVFGAEAHPDNIIGLYVNRRVLTLIGTNSIEHWQNDGITPFTRKQGTTASIGGMAPHSTVFANEVGYYWDDKRRFIRLDGYSTQILSTSYDRLIQAYATVNDCISDYITVEGNHFVRFQFPTVNKTLMYDLGNDYWTEWTFYDSATGNNYRFLGESYAYCRLWNLHIFGSWRDSNLYKMTDDAADDDGVDIHFEKITGHNDHGIQGKEKISYELNFRFKTGNVLSDQSQSKALLDWRDENAQGFSDAREIPLKHQANTNFTHVEYDLGSYESRQWRLRHTDPVPFAMGRVTERVEVLDA